MEYTSVFIIIIASFGLFYVHNKLGKKTKIVLMIFMFITCILSIQNDFTASDNPLIKRDFYNFYFSTQEIGSIETLCQMSSNRTLLSDYQTWRFIIHSNYYQKGDILEVDFNKTVFYRENNSEIIIIRENELQNRSLNLFATSRYMQDPGWNEGKFIYCHSDAEVFETLKTYNRNYDNGSVVSYN